MNFEVNKLNELHYFKRNTSHFLRFLETKIYIYCLSPHNKLKILH